MRITKTSRYWSIGGQTLVGALAVALITVFLYPAHVNAGIPAFLFLLLVVTLSLYGGFAAAAVVSIIAVGCVDYFFIPPLLEWQITDPIDAVGLFTFWATSLVITRLASNARREAETAERELREAALLYEVASRLLSLELCRWRPAPCPFAYFVRFSIPARSVYTTAQRRVSCWRDNLSRTRRTNPQRIPHRPGLS